METKIHSSLDRDEQISRYLKGRMDAQEEAQFLADMESDAQLKQDAIAQARLIRGMRQVDDEFIQALKTASESKIATSIRPRRILFRKPIAWLSMAASIAVLLFAGYNGYDYYDTTRLGMKYAKVFPMGTIVRGESNSDVELELQTLFNDVTARKDLTTATERLSELWEIANQDTYNDYTDYAPYIGWYLAIGYLEDYEKEKAKQLLKQIKVKDYPNVVIINVNDLLYKLQ